AVNRIRKDAQMQKEVQKEMRGREVALFEKGKSEGFGRSTLSKGAKGDLDVYLPSFESQGRFQPAEAKPQVHQPQQQSYQPQLTQQATYFQPAAVQVPPRQHVSRQQQQGQDVIVPPPRGGSR
ncbi:hypothetical protein HK101_011171, partial [Irineochytrium annulatum]